MLMLKTDLYSAIKSEDSEVESSFVISRLILFCELLCVVLCKIFLLQCVRECEGYLLY